MNAVIIYNQAGLAAKAAAILRRASDRAEEPIHWSVSPWREDLLTQHPVQSAAFSDASEAHLIMLAVSNRDHLSTELLGWLEIWAWCRQVKDAALAVYDGVDGGYGLSTEADPKLVEFAHRHGLSFIFGDAMPAAEEVALFREDLHEREVALTPTLAGSLAFPEYGRDWGIND